jgi:transposase
MRGEERRQWAILMIMEPGDRVPKEHPLRRVKELADAALRQLSPLFDEMYSAIGRPSIPPERLLKASLLMALYTVRSERLFSEQLDYKLLFRWFLDMDVAEPSFDHSSFSRNRARLLEHDVACEFFTHAVAQARSLQLLSDEHFTVDGTLVEAWASLKSFKRKDQEPTQPPEDPGNATVNFHGERRSNATHQSTTDPEAKLAKKGAGKEAKLCYSANALMENRNGLLIEFAVEPADGYAERKSARAMLETALPGSRGLHWEPTKATTLPSSSLRVARLRSPDFRLIAVTARDKDDVSGLDDARELMATRTVSPIVRLISHKGGVTAHGSLPPVRNRRFVVTDVWRHNPIAPVFLTSHV